jgi:hypothetical protein
MRIWPDAKTWRKLWGALRNDIEFFDRWLKGWIRDVHNSPLAGWRFLIYALINCSTILAVSFLLWPLVIILGVRDLVSDVRKEWRYWRKRRGRKE